MVQHFPDWHSDRNWRLVDRSVHEHCGIWGVVALGACVYVFCPNFRDRTHRHDIEATRATSNSALPVRSGE